MFEQLALGLPEIPPRPRPRLGVIVGGVWVHVINLQPSTFDCARCNHEFLAADAKAIEIGPDGMPGRGSRAFLSFCARCAGIIHGARRSTDDFGMRMGI